MKNEASRRQREGNGEGGGGKAQCQGDRSGSLASQRAEGPAEGGLETVGVSRGAALGSGAGPARPSVCEAIVCARRRLGSRT